MHKECQDKAFQEIKAFFKDDKDAVMEFEDLGSLPYTEMCIKESLRLFATAPISIRYAAKDFEFKSSE
jgi:cytochrome P450